MSDRPASKYGRHSKRFWLGVYLVAAVIVYGIIYLVFIHKSGGGTTGSGFSY